MVGTWRALIPLLLLMLLGACDTQEGPAGDGAVLDSVSDGTPGGTSGDAGASDGAVRVANPASRYCIEQGHRLEIRSAPDGSQAGLCIFPDNSSCEEWAFYRGECVRG